MLAETPVTQHNPCYSAVSSSLTNPLPDCSNYSPFYHTHYLILRTNTSLVPSGQILYQLRWRLILHCCSTLLQKPSQELMSSEEYHSILRKLNNKQRQVVMFLLLLFRLSSQFPFVFVFSLYLYPLSAPFLDPLSSPFPHSPSLSTILSLSLLINFLSS